MPTPTFPASLPNVVMTNYGFTPTNATIRTEMETGAARVRRRFLSAPTDFKVMWKFTMAELGMFENFFEDDIHAGAGWFNINLVNGFGEQQYLARFKDGVYDAAAAHREYHWEVTATLEVVSRPKMVITPVVPVYFQQTTNSNGQIVLTPVLNAPVINEAVSVAYPIIVGSSYIVFGENGLLSAFEIVFTAISESAVPTPTSGNYALFVNTNGILCIKDSAGIVTQSTQV